MAQNTENSVYDYLGRLTIPKNPEQKAEPTPDIAALWMGSDTTPSNQTNLTPDIKDKESFSFSDFLRGTDAVDRDRAMATQKVAGIAKSLMMQNPDMQTNDVVKYVQKLYPETWKKVNFSDAFDAIGRALEPVIVADAGRLKEKEYQDELRYRSFVNDKPVQIKNDYGFISAAYPYQGKMHEYRSWLIDRGARLQDSDRPGSRFKIVNKQDLSPETINEFYNMTQKDGTTDLALRAFDFEGLNPGEMTDMEKSDFQMRKLWADKAAKSIDFTEASKDFDKQYVVTPGSSLEKWKNSPDTHKEYLNALDRAKKAYWKYLKSDGSQGALAEFNDAMEGRFTESAGAKQQAKAESDASNRKASESHKEKMKLFSARTASINKDNKYKTDAEREAAIQNAYLEIFEGYVPNSSDKPGKYREIK